jgi:predicted RND superfamily exporter protein
MARPDLISRALAAVLRRRTLVLAIYVFLIPLAAWRAMHIPREGGIDRLIVPNDPDVAATRAFHEIFPEPQLALLVFEAPDPWAPAAIARVERAASALKAVPHIGTFTVLDALRRARPAAQLDALRELALGTTFFRKQGLVGTDYMTMIVSLDVHGPKDRDATLAAIDRALAGASIGAVRRVGSPYVSSWLERQSAAATGRSFGVFGVLLVVVTLVLYRSARALVAIVIALGASVALGIAAGGLLGFSFTIVSALVPLTIMITTLATLTYLHSRFVDQPAGTALADHHVFALRSKLRPITASTLAAAIGFAALAVSKILPIREMGLWVAVGLAISWVVAYTLFPALQAVLRTPTSERVAVSAHTYDRIAAAVPGFTYRYRHVLVAGALVACIAGAVAVVGVPGAIRPMSVQVDSLSNIDPASTLYRDLSWFRSHVMDLNIARVWIHLPSATATEPEVLQAIDRLQTDLERADNVTSVAGPTTPLRMRGYFAGHGEQLPSDADGFAEATADVEQLLLGQRELRTFISADSLADFQLQVMFRNGSAAGYAALSRNIQAAWARELASTEALRGAQLHVVGESLLAVKVGADLVPTLAESFALTAGFIFVVFLVVFRSGIDRVLAMLPSLFALLVTFLALRLAGGSLDIATIIIATTVLGTTENDQLHFFHHLHEAGAVPLGAQLRHALRVAGRAVAFATLINAIGFLGLATSEFPPLRRFGWITAAAFALALLADLTVLPAALWLVRGRRSGRSTLDA